MHEKVPGVLSIRNGSFGEHAPGDGRSSSGYQYTQYVFNEDCTWSGNAAKDVTGGYLKITNSSSGGYNHIGSGNGFSKNLSALTPSGFISRILQIAISAFLCILWML